jgi:hypothetical protein
MNELHVIFIINSSHAKFVMKDGTWHIFLCNLILFFIIICATQDLRGDIYFLSILLLFRP